MRNLASQAILAAAIGLAPLLGSGGADAAGFAFGPEKSLGEIRDAVRAARKDTAPVTVVLEDGVYRVPETVTFGAEDSGVTLSARHPGKAVLTGARDPAWRRPTDAELRTAPLSALSDGAKAVVRIADLPGSEPLPGFFTGGCMLQYDAKLDHPLFLVRDGDWLPLSQYPNGAWLRANRYLGGVRTIGSRACGGVPEYKDAAIAVEDETARLTAWAAEPDLWAHGFWAQEWCDARLPVTNVDVASKSFRLREDYPFKFHEKIRYRIMNAVSEIDSPGEWMLDRTHRRLVLWPKGGPLPTLPWTKTLLAVSKARDLTFEGLVFEQAREGAVAIADSERVTVRKSLVRDCGAWGVTVTGGHDCRVVGCDLCRLGEGGISLSGGDATTLRPANHVADNNHIHHFGLVIPNSRPGVSLAGVGCRVTHNLIHHTQHLGVRFRGNDHYFGYNVIHDTCMQNNDAGAIYSCQRSLWKRGTVIERNLVYCTGKKPTPTECHAIYLDDWTSGMRVRNNILVRASLGVSMGGGHNTLVTSNVIVRMLEAPVGFSSRGLGSFAEGAAKMGFASSLMKDLASKTNAAAAHPQAWGRYPHLFEPLTFDSPAGTDPGQYAHHQLWSEVSDNLYVCSPAFRDTYFKKVAAYNLYANNAATADDPFADYARLDFSAKKGGPHETLVAACEFPKMGLYASTDRFSAPVRYGADVTPAETRLDRLFRRPQAHIDVSVEKLPAGVERMATDLTDCEIPYWASGKRICSKRELDRDDRAWREHSFAFTPTCDVSAVLCLMGSYGRKTAYDGIRISGAELRSPGFETPDGWRLVRDPPAAAVGDVSRPFGIVGACGGVRPREGNRMLLANNDLIVRQPIRLTKGRRVEITFWACGL